MAISTTIDSTLGVVSSVVSDAGSISLNGGVKTQVSAFTAAGTFSLANTGVITVSGSAALTFVMPTATSCPGSMFIVRSLSNHAHKLTGSQETSGVKVFSLLASGSSTVNGSALTLALGGAAGAATGGGPSVALLSDGVNFLVIGSSGSVALSGT